MQNGRMARYDTIIGLAIVVGLTGWAAAGDQPQWGEKFTRNQVSAEKNLPESFDPASGKNVRWVAKLGTETHGTPIVANGRVFIGTNNGEPRDERHQGDRGVFMCFDEKDGKLLWQLVAPKMKRLVSPAQVEDPNGPTDAYLDWVNAGICSPATVEGDRVYTVTNRGEVVCLDIHGMANGNDGPFVSEGQHMTPAGAAPMQPGPLDADILWTFDLIWQAGAYPHDSRHCSILVDGDLLYINSCNGVDNTHRNIRRPDAPSLVVLDKRTGLLVARDGERLGPGIFHCLWSSPSMGEVNGQKQVYFGGNGVVYAFAALIGVPREVQVLQCVWRFDCDPTAPKEDVHRYTTNRKEGPSNIKGMPVFYKNRVYVAAGGDLWWGKHQAWLKCIDATKTGDITTSGELWTYPLGSHCMSTSAIHDGLLYISDCARNIHCIDAETGKPYWVHQTRGEMWASTLVADGKVYAATRRGEVVILAAGKEKKVLSTTDLGSPISGTPVAANGAVYIATFTHLYAIGKSAE